MATRAGLRRVVKVGIRLVVLGVAAVFMPKLAVAAQDPAASPLPRVTVRDGKFVLPDGRRFFPIGVNYFRPGTGWAPQLWKQFDEAAVERDFALLRQHGVRCVRVFLTWGSFFSQPDHLDDFGLERLDRMLKIAEKNGIYLHPTGPDHWEGVPDWARGDRYSDERLLAAQERFWQLLAGRYRGRTSIFAYDLLNEPAVPWNGPALRERWKAYLRQCYGTADSAAEAWGIPADDVNWEDPGPPDPAKSPAAQILAYQHFREEVARQWVARQAASIRKVDPDALVTVGLIQWSVPLILPGVTTYSAFRPERIAPDLDFLEVHFYPLARGFLDYQRPEDITANLIYLRSTVAACAAAKRPVVLAEFGWYGGGRLTIDQGRHPPASESRQAEWCRSAIESTRDLAEGWLNWGVFDHPEARDVSQLTGLFTTDGRPKEWARVFRDISEGLAGDARGSRATGAEPARLPIAKLDWDQAIVNPQVGRQALEQAIQAWDKGSRE
ncbi:MAG: cellulase family glycosylhydrolase [Thermogutta sp.]|nr:cellulase family glycosylhydrolase [Thermogutta sp.]